MEKLLQCNRCKTKFGISDLTFIGEKKKFCKSCLVEYKKERAETEAYKKLINYICEGYGVKSPHRKVFRDIGSLKNKGYSYYDIQFAIYYIINVRKIQMSMKDFGLIEHIIDESINFRIQFENARRTANRTLSKEVVIKTSPKLKPNSNNTRIVNIGEL